MPRRQGDGGTPPNALLIFLTIVGTHVHCGQHEDTQVLHTGPKAVCSPLDESLIGRSS